MKQKRMDSEIPLLSQGEKNVNWNLGNYTFSLNSEVGTVLFSLVESGLFDSRLGFVHGIQEEGLLTLIFQS